MSNFRCKAWSFVTVLSLSNPAVSFTASITSMKFPGFMASSKVRIEDLLRIVCRNLPADGFFGGYSHVLKGHVHVF